VFLVRFKSYTVVAWCCTTSEIVFCDEFSLNFSFRVVVDVTELSKAALGDYRRHVDTHASISTETDSLRRDCEALLSMVETANCQLLNMDSAVLGLSVDIAYHRAVINLPVGALLNERDTKIILRKSSMD